MQSEVLSPTPSSALGLRRGRKQVGPWAKARGDAQEGRRAGFDWHRPAAGSAVEVLLCLRVPCRWREDSGMSYWLARARAAAEEEAQARPQGRYSPFCLSPGRKSSFTPPGRNPGTAENWYVPAPEATGPTRPVARCQPYAGQASCRHRLAFPPPLWMERRALGQRFDGLALVTNLSRSGLGDSLPPISALCLVGGVDPLSPAQGLCLLPRPLARPCRTA